MLWTAETILTPNGEVHGAGLLVRDGVIAEIGPVEDLSRPGVTRRDYPGTTLVPGFIDTHIHGALGRETIEGSVEALNTIGRYLASHGVTSWLPTTVTAPLDETRAALEAIRTARDNPDPTLPRVLGAHMEGPYVNPSRRGGQREAYIRPPDANEALDLCGDVVRIVTMAPEMPGGLELVSALSRAGIRVSAGHSDASYDTVLQAVEKGLCSVTHAYNAMSPLHHRDPGLVGAAMAEPTLDVELICDLVHVHPGAIRAMVRAKGVDRVLIVSDSVPGAGLPDGDYQRGGRIVHIQGGRAMLDDGILSGSTTSLDQEIRNMVHVIGLPLADAVRMASTNPARALGLEGCLGRLSQGTFADFVMLDADLQVVATVAAGVVIYDAHHQ